ncbi:MAG TPA: PilZ domain-containing protein [Candidatus Sulfotelmatobacter sp.]|nr:PilZ domain-containing protein [Candidatus Sulfotelmatobacter sp.]
MPDTAKLKCVHKRHQAKSPDGDRRHFTRASEVELVVNINGRLVEVLDISLSGIRIGNGFPLQGDKVGFTIIPRVGQRLDVNRSIRASGQVIRIDGDEHSVAIRFERVSYSLAKMIVAAVSQRLGVKPFLLA